jgi:hypothetical protein
MHLRGPGRVIFQEVDHTHYSHVLEKWSIEKSRFNAAFRDVPHVARWVAK